MIRRIALACLLLGAVAWGQTRVDGIGSSAPKSANYLCTDSSGNFQKSGCIIPYTFSFAGASGTISASATGLTPIYAASTFASNFSGVTVQCGTNPTADTAFAVKDNTTSIGTLTVHSNCTVSGSTSGTYSISANHQLYVIAPGSPDATALNISFIIPATRN